MLKRIWDWFCQPHDDRLEWEQRWRRMRDETRLAAYVASLGDWQERLELVTLHRKKMGQRMFWAWWQGRCVVMVERVK
jgi:hypothetical protein